MGIKYEVEDDQIYIANKTPALLKVYKGTPWADGAHAKRLKRLGGSNAGNKAHRFGSQPPSKATALSWELVFPEIASSDDEENHEDEEEED